MTDTNRYLNDVETELYRNFHANEDEPETVEAEVVDDEKPSGAADISKDAKVVHQTIVNQYGDNPVHIDHVENLKL